MVACTKPSARLPSRTTTTSIHDRDGHHRPDGHVEVAKQLFDHLIARTTFSRERRSRPDTP
jgi:hypothetical protein